jgi:hypothetical protein
VVEPKPSMYKALGSTPNSTQNFILFFWHFLGFELRAHTLSCSSSPFRKYLLFVFLQTFLCWVFSEIESRVLFAQAEFGHDPLISVS